MNMQLSGVTCEESGSNGQVWEVDPTMGADSQ